MTNLKNLVTALIILITASTEPERVCFEEAVRLTSHLEAPIEWLKAVLFGWGDYARRYKKPLFKELAKRGSPRFLTVRLRRIKSTKAERFSK